MLSDCTALQTTVYLAYLHPYKWGRQNNRKCILLGVPNKLLTECISFKISTANVVEQVEGSFADWPLGPLTFLSPLAVSHPSLHAYSQISETSLSCELTRWSGAVGRDPKPLIRRLYPLPIITFFPVSQWSVSTLRLQMTKTEKRDRTEPLF